MIILSHWDGLILITDFWLTIIDTLPFYADYVYWFLLLIIFQNEFVLLN